MEFGSGWVYAAALLPPIPFAAAVWALIRVARASDELERRLHLKAMAVAFPLTMLMLMVLGLLEVGVELDRQNLAYRHLWGLMPLFYAGGLIAARRRYGQ